MSDILPFSCRTRFPLIVFPRPGPMLRQTAELVNVLSGTLLADHETTTNLIGNSLVLLLEHPEQRKHPVTAWRLLVQAEFYKCGALLVDPAWDRLLSPGSEYLIYLSAHSRLPR
jgi:hypothetical protein